MRKLLIALTLTAAVATGCGLTGLGMGSLSNIFSSLGGCDIYDSNDDGVVTADEVRDLFNMLGIPAETFGDADLLDALQQLGCTTG